MNPWPFVIASYVVGVGGTVALALWAWAAMRKAERAVDKLRDGE